MRISAAEKLGETRPDGLRRALWRVQLGQKPQTSAEAALAHWCKGNWLLSDDAQLAGVGAIPLV